jgi:hypothetical protein
MCCRVENSDEIDFIISFLQNNSDNYCLDENLPSAAPGVAF